MRKRLVFEIHKRPSDGRFAVLATYILPEIRLFGIRLRREKKRVIGWQNYSVIYDDESGIRYNFGDSTSTINHATYEEALYVAKRAHKRYAPELYEKQSTLQGTFPPSAEQFEELREELTHYMIQAANDGDTESEQYFLDKLQTLTNARDHYLTKHPRVNS